MKKYDKYLSNKTNEYENKIISSSSPLNNGSNFIQSYNEKNFFSPEYYNKYLLANNNIINIKPQINNKKNDYSYYFQYDDKKIKDFLHNKKKNDKNNNTKFEFDKINNNTNNEYNSQIVFKKNNDYLNWHDNFKNSNFYQEVNTNGINKDEINKDENNKDVNNKENKENNEKYFLQNEINEIANSFKNINIHNKNNNSLELYLIKNKYAELF